MVLIDRPCLPLHFRPLKSKKRFSVVEQLTLGQVSIMWIPLQKNSIAVCPQFDISSIAAEGQSKSVNLLRRFFF